MKLVGIRLVKSTFEGQTYEKYECHLLDSRRLPGMTGQAVHQYDVRMKALEDDFAFEIGKNYDFVFEDGKVVAVYEVE